MFLFVALFRDNWRDKITLKSSSVGLQKKLLNMLMDIDLSSASFWSDDLKFWENFTSYFEGEKKWLNSTNIITKSHFSLNCQYLIIFFLKIINSTQFFILITSITSTTEEVEVLVFNLYFFFSSKYKHTCA